MRLALALILMLVPALATAQGTANLVADSVSIADGTLEASGNVQVIYGDVTLSAASIRYNQQADLLTIQGPIFIRSADGTIVTAEQASLDPRLENGILRSARLVLDQQLQLAANQIDRVDGRFSQLTRTVATSCQVCGTRAPLWEIRAERVVHDEVEQQIYFTNATFHIRGVPILWIPRMRLPDPTLERATGFLIPRIRSNDRVGTGIRIPYFIRIGDSRDLTLTPFFSRESSTLEARYRQAFLSGSLEITGAVSRDTLIEDDTRSYFFARGEFDLGQDIQLQFDIESTSDPAYLLDYGFSDKDRLDSSIAITRVRDQDLLVADLTYYETLRDDEVNETLPPVVLNFGYERRLTETPLGGVLTLTASADGFLRTADALGDDARDMTRVGAAADWTRNWVLSGGLVLDVTAHAQIDHFTINDDPAFESGWRQTAATAATLRWPLIQRTETATHILEPMVSLGWAGSGGIAPPNEDGTLAEFDEANLAALSRFPGDDALETGTHTAIALSWSRFGTGGTDSRLTFGRIFQDQPQQGFSPGSGLSQQTSDWLLSAHLTLPGGLALDTRALFDNRFDFDKTEARLTWTNSEIDLTAAYHWLPSDPTRDRLEPASEWSVDATYQIDDHWMVSFDGRYDVASDTPRRAGLGLAWQNECVTVDLSVSRRYTSSDTVAPTTDYGFSVSLSGFSAGRSNPGPSRSCDQ